MALAKLQELLYPVAAAAAAGEKPALPRVDSPTFSAGGRKRVRVDGVSPPHIVAGSALEASALIKAACPRGQ